MCGILAEINFKKEINTSFLNLASKKIDHRGPDDEGKYFSKNFCIIHKRLSIIDTSKNGINPIFNNHNNVSCTLNGMIYNFEEIKKKLQSKYNFKSKTDTEVILYSYIEWGIKAFEMFKGMFVFVIHDNRNEEKVFIVRDKLGIKPLYYQENNNSLLICSEITPLTKLIGNKSINKEFLNDYLLFNYPLKTSNCLIDSIKILEPATFIEITEKKIDKIKYWSIKYNRSGITLNDFDEIFQETIRKHLIADTSIASTLSSGIDSSIISYLSNKHAKNISNFSVSFEGHDIDESEDVIKFAKFHNFNLNLIKFDQNTFFENLNETIETLEEPRVGISVQNYFLYKMINSHSHKVTLSGLGGDEMFAGYYWRYLQDHENFKMKYFNLIAKPGNLNNLLNKNYKFSNDDNIFRFKKEMNRFNDLSPLKKCLNFEINTFLHSLLIVEDKISMRHGIESRVPLLDEDVMNFAFNLKDKDLANYKAGKIFFTNYVNKKCQISRFNKQKKGFVVPHSDWLSNKNQLLESILSKDEIFYNYFDKKKIFNILTDNSNDKNIGQYVWKLLSLKKSFQNLNINA